MAHLTRALPPLSHPGFLAVKAGLAALLALALNHLLDNPDAVSASFVAVLCVSPTLLMGLKRAGQQLIGSLLGGVCGCLAMLAGLAPEIGIPVAVGLSVLASLQLGFELAWPATAFSALFLQAVPRGSPLETFGVRLVSIGIAACSGLLVNALVSAGSYARLFARRLRVVEAHAEAALQAAAERGDHAPCEAALALLNRAAAEWTSALRELGWRQRPVLEARLRNGALRLAAWRRLLRGSLELAAAAPEASVTPENQARLAAWLWRPDAQPPEGLPAALQPLAERMGQLRRELGYTDTASP